MSGAQPAMPAVVARVYEDHDRWSAVLHDPWATLAARANARLKLDAIEQALSAHEA